jgi:hypothetical protein
VPLGRELPLPGHPRLADLDVSDRIRAHLVGIAFQDREIRFLALFERAEAIALSKLPRGVDRYGADRVVKRNDLIGAIDPERPLKIGPVNRREARESGLRLKASVAPGARSNAP